LKRLGSRPVGRLFHLKEITATRERLSSAPQQLGWVFPERPIRGENHQILDQGLRDEHPVKWVRMVRSKIVNLRRVTVIDRERPKTLLGHESRNVLCRWPREIQPSHAHF
jgi:hypothetical protein